MILKIIFRSEKTTWNVFIINLHFILFRIFIFICLFLILCVNITFMLSYMKFPVIRLSIFVSKFIKLKQKQSELLVKIALNNNLFHMIALHYLLSL